MGVRGLGLDERCSVLQTSLKLFKVGPISGCSFRIGGHGEVEATESILVVLTRMSVQGVPNPLFGCGLSN